jgi:hypothetical protein
MDMEPVHVGAYIEILGTRPAKPSVKQNLAAISNFVVMVLTIGLMIHLFSILTEAGLSRTRAAWLTSLSGAAGIVGKRTTGMLLDRLGSVFKVMRRSATYSPSSASRWR